MNDPVPEAVERRCDDLAYRLAVYEAGHALSARALGLSILNITMLPRPPVMASDKVMRGSLLSALTSVLESRCIELFGGQIAEHHACHSATVFSGDVARIDELCRLISGIEGRRTVEEVWFELEDVAEAVFADDAIRAAILPLADFLFNEVEAGRPVVPGEKVEELLDGLVGPRAGKGSRGLAARILPKLRSRQPV